MEAPMEAEDLREARDSMTSRLPGFQDTWNKPEDAGESRTGMVPHCNLALRDSEA